MENENQVFELIEKFDFSELNKDQQELVLIEMTEREYSEMRNTISLTSSYFESESILIKDELTAPVLKRKNILINIINYQLPIYKVAAMIMVVFSLNYLLFDEPVPDCKVVDAVSLSQVESDSFSEYAVYSSNNSIKYNKGLSRVFY
jgi:hypothetical protein